MRLHEGAVIHAVELIAGEDQHLVHIPALKQLLVLPHRIGGALKPAWAGGRLLSGKHFHEATAEAAGEVVGEAEVAVERLTVELGEHVDLLDPRVDAVAHRDVDQPVFSTQGHGRFGPGGGEGLQAGTGTAAQDDGQYTLHAPISRLIRK